MLFHANATNDVWYFLATQATPTTPVSGATVTVTATLAGNTIGSANRAMSYSSTLPVAPGKTGGYAMTTPFTAAEITAAGQQYQVTIVAVVGGATVDTTVLTVPCTTNRGQD